MTDAQTIERLRASRDTAGPRARFVVDVTPGGGCVVMLRTDDGVIARDRLPGTDARAAFFALRDAVW